MCQQRPLSFHCRHAVTVNCLINTFFTTDSLTALALFLCGRSRQRLKDNKSFPFPSTWSFLLHPTRSSPRNIFPILYHKKKLVRPFWNFRSCTVSHHWIPYSYKITPLLLRKKQQQQKGSETSRTRHYAHSCVFVRLWLFSSYACRPWMRSRVLSLFLYAPPPPTKIDQTKEMGANKNFLK